MRKLRLSAGYLIIACIITCLLGLYRIHTPSDEVSLFITNISYGYQGRSIFSALIMCLLGFISVFLMQKEWKANRMLIYAFPVGVFSWICFSVLIICVGLPYKIITMIFIYIIFWLILTQFNQFDIRKIINIEFLSYVCFMIGTIIILSSCILPIFQSYDSYYFIDFFGQSIARNAGLYEGSASMAMHTALGMATLSAYNAFWKLDNTYLIQYCVMISFLLMYAVSLYEYKVSFKNCKFATAVIVILVFAEPCVLQLMCWNISNAYYMVLLFMIYLELSSVINSNVWTIGNRIFVPVLICAASYLRAEAPLFICCIIIAMLATKLKRKDIFMELILPAMASSLLLYFRLYILSGTALNGSFLSVSTVLLMLGLYCLVAIIAALSGIIVFSKVFAARLYLLLFAVVVIVGIVLFVIDKGVFGGSLKVYLHNMSNVDDFWGVSAGVVLFLFFIQYFIGNEKNNFGNILCILLFFAILYLGPARAIIDEPPRKGYGDSFNRNFVSLLPLVWHVVVSGIIGFFSKGNQQYNR